MTNLLFSFGTLRQDNVQQALFGRPVPSTPDTIVGYRVGRVRITDPAAIEASGTDIHPALIETDDPAQMVEGQVLELTDEDLAAADVYEQVSFRAIEVRTRSGRTAIAYAPKPELTLEPDEAS